MTEPFDPAAVSFTDETDPIVPGTLGDSGGPVDPETPPDGVPVEQHGLWHKINAEKNRPRTQRSAKAPKAIPPKPRPGALVKPLTDLYTSIGTMMIPFDQPCGLAIVANAETCAKSLENLARENPAVRRALLAMVETSVWGQVIAAHAPILVAITMHHVPAVRKQMDAIREAQSTGGPQTVEDYLGSGDTNGG